MNTNRLGKGIGTALAVGLVALGLVVLGSTANAQSTAAATPDVAAAKFWETGASVYWNRRAIQLFRARGGGPGRIDAYLSIAQYRAILAAMADQSGPPRASSAAAAAGASVVVLKQFYALDAATLESEITAQRSGPSWPGEQQADFAKGEAIGRQVGAAVLAQAATDGFGALDPGSPPVGDGYWHSATPSVRGGYGARPFFISYGGDLLAPPPPAFGSPAYLAALAEVRTISETRTAEQLAIAAKWVPFSGVLFDLLATDLIVKYRRSELEAARILAYANAAAYDAIVGCFYTKFHYWFVRPSMADPAITTPLGLPNHPSYPSAHSCETGAFQTVLADAFPAERDMLAALAAEASVSRVYGGLHYRFDGEAGLEIGRKAARIALEQRGLE
jgi:membrane-associated phospholipid phosphatase